ncbi:hypothetical protein HPK19_25355 (plasmid) [Arthrobacter citreus]|nr:hypothetical protein HPK19_25355 [Arthrobacter citreus]
MINYRDAESYLKDKIAENSSDIDKVWDVFKSFGREKVEGEDRITLMFLCGAYDLTGKKLFYYNFVRQFTIVEDGQMEQLNCEFVFEPTEELIDLETSEFYFDFGGDVEDFYIHIESLEEFKVPMKRKPIRFNLYQEEVKSY